MKQRAKTNLIMFKTYEKSSITIDSKTCEQSVTFHFCIISTALSTGKSTRKIVNSIYLQFKITYTEQCCAIA